MMLPVSAARSGSHLKTIMCTASQNHFSRLAQPCNQKEKKFHEGAVAETPSHPSSRFKCSCDRSFPNKNQLGEHKERSFPNKNKLGEHKEREHLGLVYKCGRLGIPWSQPLPTPQLNSQAAATASMELQAATGAVKQEVVELEDELQAEEKAEEEESKEKGSGGAGELVRCGFCPSPGLVPVTEKIKHQAGHLAATFSCAACSGRRRFELFAEVVKHVHTLHDVTDGLMVLETIILPGKLTKLDQLLI